MKLLKALICVVMVSLLAAAALLPVHRVSGERSVEASAGGDAPDIDRFNATIQTRFLTEPFFGIARMAPREPQPLRSSHVASFHPKNGEETELFGSFQKDGWDVGLYLYGRRAHPDERRKDPMEKFRIRYRVNEPLPITPDLKVKDLPNPKKLMEEVKRAFIKFQSAGGGAEKSVEFSRGKWNFVAKPVRVMNDNCLKCHTDYVITEKLGNNQFKFRKRQLGDVNGVILYAYTKHKP